MNLREKAVPFVLLACGCAAFLASALLGEGETVAEAAPVEMPAVAAAVTLGLAALGALAWVPAGVLLMRRGIGPPKGAGTRAGLLDVVGATGAFLFAIAAFSLALGSGRSAPVRMGAVAAAQSTAVAYVWIRLRAFPGSFGGSFRNLLLGAAAYLLALPLLTLTGVVNGYAMKALGLQPQTHPALRVFMTDASVPEAVCMFVLGAAVAPFVEEVVFRGILYGALRKRLGPVSAAALSGAVFAAIHVQPAQFLPLLVLGVAFALLYEHTGSLAAPVGLHAANNALTFGVVIAARLCAPGGG